MPKRQTLVSSQPSQDLGQPDIPGVVCLASTTKSPDKSGSLFWGRPALLAAPASQREQARPKNKVPNSLGSYHNYLSGKIVPHQGMGFHDLGRCFKKMHRINTLPSLDRYPTIEWDSLSGTPGEVCMRKYPAQKTFEMIVAGNRPCPDDLSI